jgi:hypothetical protein
MDKGVIGPSELSSLSLDSSLYRRRRRFKGGVVTGASLAGGVGIS